MFLSALVCFFFSLETLYLNGNSISSISPIPQGTFKKLEYLRLDDNKICEWSSIDALNGFPALRRLRIKGNPVLAELAGELASSHIVGRIKGLTVVDGNTLTPHERNDYERYYLTLCTKDGTTHDAIACIHPRYKELCQIHGEPSVGSTTKEGPAMTLKDRLMSIKFCVRTLDEVEHPLASRPPATPQMVEKRVLATAKIRNLKHMIQKLFTIPAGRQRLFLLQDSPQRVLELVDDLRDLHFYGAAAGDEIAVVIKD
ncbi:hypothetical protein BX666DRAFT_1241407 [Dichotomocladium elegans]|nr:hypothetical protein BX666DRAFT_1241407 [Dichotomocladium elegans]